MWELHVGAGGHVSSGNQVPVESYLCAGWSLSAALASGRWAKLLFGPINADPSPAHSYHLAAGYHLVGLVRRASLLVHMYLVIYHKSIY